MSKTQEKLKQNFETSSTEELWEIFSSDMNSGINSFIPTKMSKQTNSLPWITKDLKKLMNKRDQLYKKKKNSPPNIEISKNPFSKKFVHRISNILKILLRQRQTLNLVV
jgi:hypothetical protein